MTPACTEVGSRWAPATHTIGSFLPRAASWLACCVACHLLSHATGANGRPCAMMYSSGVHTCDRARKTTTRCPVVQLSAAASMASCCPHAVASFIRRLTQAHRNVDTTCTVMRVAAEKSRQGKQSLCADASTPYEDRTSHCTQACITASRHASVHTNAFATHVHGRCMHSCLPHRCAHASAHAIVGSAPHPRACLHCQRRDRASNPRQD